MGSAHNSRSPFRSIENSFFELKAPECSGKHIWIFPPDHLISGAFRFINSLFAKAQNLRFFFLVKDIKGAFVCHLAKWNKVLTFRTGSSPFEIFSNNKWTPLKADAKFCLYSRV